MDTTRADHLTPYGYLRPTTPFLARLAGEGVLFESIISPAATTSPSIGSMLTGVLPFEHGVRTVGSLGASALDPQRPTVAEILAGRGFDTAAFVSAITASARFGFARGFRVFEEPDPEMRGQLSADQVNRSLLAWLRTRPRSGRFFALAHYFDVHDLQLQAPRAFTDAFVDRQVRGLARRIARYDGELLFLDRNLAEVVETLDREGLSRTTAVIVTADHGQGLGDHHFLTHGLLYEEQVRVPFIVRGPTVSRGIRVRERLSALNLAPTILDLAGVPPSLWPSGLRGKSLRPWLDGGRAPADRLILAESHNVLLRRRPPAPSRGEVYSAMDGAWKYVYYPRAPRGELFHLGRDPGELRDLSEAETARVQRLHQVLVDAGIMTPLAEWTPSDLPPAQLEALRALGYVE